MEDSKNDFVDTRGGLSDDASSLAVVNAPFCNSQNKRWVSN